MASPKSKRSSRSHASGSGSAGRTSRGRVTPKSQPSKATAGTLAEGELSRGSVTQRRRHLDQRLTLLHQRAMALEKEISALDDSRFYRCCIFGSARIKAGSKAYEDVVTLARCLSWESIDVLTGGGPGLMEAANKGAMLGRQEKKSRSLSFGISIELDFEPVPNQHLDVKRHHHRFSSRLDDFMRLSHSVVVTPGGIGTLLELFFTWQLLQVRHISARPIVLMGKQFWGGLIEWMRSVPLAQSLISPQDFDHIQIVDSPESAVEIISAHHKQLITHTI